MSSANANLASIASVTPASATPWTPASWRGKPGLQMPTYPDAQALAGAQEELRALPPLVTSREILSLKQQLAEAQEGKRFLLQGGDCAETFAECNSEVITNRLKVLLQMSLVLVHGLKVPVVRVGRFAGQYAKPRSADSEERDGMSLPSYRGDIVNGPEFTAEARVPDPRRMIKAHARSAMTMNFVRALIDGGFADLHHPEYWGLGWVTQSPHAAEYQEMVANIGDALRFMETLAGRQLQSFNRVDFYTSHEALLLPYEEAQTRQVPRAPGWFNLSTHFPWIGMRTAQLDGAHVEYFRGIENPIALKVGPSVTPEQLLRVIDALGPEHSGGFVVRVSAPHGAQAVRLPDTSVPPGRVPPGRPALAAAAQLRRRRRAPSPAAARPSSIKPHCDSVGTAVTAATGAACGVTATGADAAPVPTALTAATVQS